MFPPFLSKDGHNSYNLFLRNLKRELSLIRTWTQEEFDLINEIDNNTQV